MYRMTYNNKGITGCSARGVAKRETVDELLELAESLKESICNIQIHSVAEGEKITMPMKLETNMKQLR